MNTQKTISSDFFEKDWDQSWTYMKTVVDVVREPVLILDEDLRVIAANEPFYKVFKVKPRETEGEVVYKLGNGQWDLPVLRKLLENILPKHTFFKGFEVEHDFLAIGRKTMILNARRIHLRPEGEKQIPGESPHIILLAIEDITEMITIAAKLSKHTNEFEAKIAERTEKLDIHIKKLEKEIHHLKREHKI